jgi:hypothetical protein
MKADENVKEANNEERRDFIKTATKLSGAVALLGISAESFGVIIGAEGAQAQNPDARMRAIQLLFTEAIEQGDMRTAVDKYRGEAKLNDSQLRALMSISREELVALKSLRGKLTPLKLPEWVMATGDCSSPPPPPPDGGGGGGGGSGPIPPYGIAIRNAVARGDLQEMKNVGANARKFMADVNSALAELDKAIKKLSK